MFEKSCREQWGKKLPAEKLSAISLVLVLETPPVGADSDGDNPRSTSRIELPWNRSPFSRFRSTASPGGTNWAWLAIVGLLAVWAWRPALSLAEEWRIDAPIPRQVVQRQHFDPRKAHEHNPGGADLGRADVLIRGHFPRLATATMEYRVVPLEGAFGRAIDWTPARPTAKGTDDAADELRADVPAGGWYKLEIRGRVGDKIVGQAAVEPIGVGEVLVIAGQSYADGANDERLAIADPLGRAVSYDVANKSWQTADDPQPNSADGGTIWPPLADTLLPLAQVPVGFVNVAVGGTSSRQWLPGEQLYQRLESAGLATGRFRAVLWQQGESDVIEKVSTGQYVKNLTAIRAALAQAWGFEPPWLLAKSTFHPTVYNDPQHEGQIRDAIDQLWRLPGFRPGPDTDILSGENRGGLGTRRHFTGLGQRRAALLWFAAVWPEMHRTE
ncbi:MAG: sialate O-acetylesterase [Pirellulales bacterium]